MAAATTANISKEVYIDPKPPMIAPKPFVLAASVNKWMSVDLMRSGVWYDGGLVPGLQ